jgi:hypothetical protein
VPISFRFYLTFRTVVQNNFRKLSTISSVIKISHIFFLNLGDYAGAAKRLAEDKSIGIMAGVDSTQQQQLSSIFNVKGFPTLKYFYKGKEYEEYNGNRRKMDFVEYLKKKIVASQKDEL